MRSFSLILYTAIYFIHRDVRERRKHEFPPSLNSPAAPTVREVLERCATVINRLDNPSCGRWLVLPDALKNTVKILQRAARPPDLHQESNMCRICAPTSSCGRHSPRSSSASPRFTGCKRGVENDMITCTCKSTTMALFTEQIHRAAPGYFDHPVVDETGLTGAFDFTISWTPRGRLQGGGGRGGDAPPPEKSAGGAPVASDPGGLSVFEAADKMLGLKFESQKRPMAVIVIDKISPLAAEN
jgi:hypothetical protein